jgi:hypothetical protein
VFTQAAIVFPTAVSESRGERLRFVLLLLLAFVPVFALTARWGTNANPDVLATALPAWSLVNSGSVDISEQKVLPVNPTTLGRYWVDSTEGSLVSNRPAALIALSIPMYWANGNTQFTVGPSTVAAIMCTTLALLILWAVFARLVGRWFAFAAVIVFGYGTTTWAVSAAELWPHGPGQLWAALAALGLAHHSYTSAGIAFALSVLTRPLTAIFPAVTGLLESWRTRNWKPALQIGVLSLIGLVLLMTYNRLMFGVWSIRGGYGDDFTVGAVEGFAIQGYLSNLFQMLIGPRNGFLLLSPIILVSAYGGIRDHSAVPGWAKSTAWAALCYLLVHAALNRASGGLIVFYRYPLEALTLASPFLVMGAQRLWNAGQASRYAVFTAATVSVILQVLNVFYISCFTTDPLVSTCLMR